MTGVEGGFFQGSVGHRVHQRPCAGSEQTRITVLCAPGVVKITSVALFMLIAAAGLVAVARHARPVSSVSDTAVIESYTLYASRAQLLVGPYSRYGWHHPGPLYFYLLAPFYVLSGKLSAGLNAGALAINLLAVIVIASVVWRVARGVLAVAIVAMLVVYSWRVAPLLASPWNPHMVVFPLMALIVVAAAIVSGWIELLPLAALMGSIAVQTHLGVLPGVVAVSAIALGFAMFSAGSAVPIGRAVGILSVTLCLIVVLWAVPVWEEMTRAPGNLTTLWRFFFTGHRGAQTLRNAYVAWTDMLAGILRPDLRLADGSPFRRSHIRWSEGCAAAEVVLLAITATLGVRAGRRFQAALSGLLVLGAMMALWSATRIDDAIVDHEVFWISGLGTLATATLLDAGLSALWRRRIPARLSFLACAAGVCAIGALGVHQLLLVTDRTFAPGPQQVAAATLGDALNKRIRNMNVRPLIKVDQDTWPVAAGVLLNLQKSGSPFAVDADWLPMFTERAAATGHETEVVAIVGPERHFLLTAEDRASTIASADPYFLIAMK
jgi:hypothetical protein